MCFLLLSPSPLYTLILIFDQVCLSGLCRCGPLICPSVCYSAYWVLPEVWIQWCKGQAGCSSKGRTEPFQRQVIKGPLHMAHAACHAHTAASASHLRACRPPSKALWESLFWRGKLDMFVKDTVSVLFLKPKAYLALMQKVNWHSPCSLLKTLNNRDFQVKDVNGISLIYIPGWFSENMVTISRFADCGRSRKDRNVHVCIYMLIHLFPVVEYFDGTNSLDCSLTSISKLKDFYLNVSIIYLSICTHMLAKWWVTMAVTGF